MDGADGADRAGSPRLVGLAQQRAFLETVLDARRGEASEVRVRAPRELAAGLPLEAARALLLLGPDPAGAPWRRLPAELACCAAALRLFARLVATEDAACSRFCGAMGDASAGVEIAAAWGLEMRGVHSAADTLRAMLGNRLAVCCAVLEAYIGVVEDPESGEELEVDVGAHCVMVVGGDLLGCHVVFDPFGLRGGGLAYWSAKDFESAQVARWVELSQP